MDEPRKKGAGPGGRRARAKAGAPPTATAEDTGRRAPEEPGAAFGSSVATRAQSLLPCAALIGAGLLFESEILVGIALGAGIGIVTGWLPNAVVDRVESVVDSAVQSCCSAAAKTGAILGEAAHGVESLFIRGSFPARESAIAQDETPHG